ncbi:MAG: single-stranded DNA-binding protein [Solirubrobacterales bacterium]|nr:single-stranded DNA-binding protein [Solirubrobacterales bacterium]
MNNVSLVGRLTCDPELKEIGGGRSVCELRLAVDNPGHGAGKGEPTYVDVSTFGGQAEACVAHLAKGRQVAVSGQLVFREWTARDGSKRSARLVRGRVEFLGSRAGEDGAGRLEPEEMALAF